jgi:hypothetical protein
VGHRCWLCCRTPILHSRPSCVSCQAEMLLLWCCPPLCMHTLTCTALGDAHCCVTGILMWLAPKCVVCQISPNPSAGTQLRHGAYYGSSLALCWLFGPATYYTSEVSWPSQRLLGMLYSCRASRMLLACIELVKTSLASTWYRCDTV